MPGTPFKAPFRGGKTKASPGRPSKPGRWSPRIPKPASANGLTTRRVSQPSSPTPKIDTKARHSVKPPRVRKGTQLGTPGRHS